MFVVAGGRNKQTSEILDLDTLTWRDGPPFSSIVDRSSSTQYGNTLVVVAANGIYEFDPEHEAWITLDETLDPARSEVVPIFVSDRIVNCS